MTPTNQQETGTNPQRAEERERMRRLAEDSFLEENRPLPIFPESTDLFLLFGGVYAD